MRTRWQQVLDIIIFVTVVLGLSWLIAVAKPRPAQPAIVLAPAAPAFYGGPGERSAHRLAMHTRSEGVGCSATAVGPHTILTAAHCILGSGQVAVDGVRRNIVASFYDENDHVLLRVDGAAWGDVAKLDERAPLPGEHVRQWGYPGAARFLIGRDGRFVGTRAGEDCYQLLVWHGDSGSGIVADDGRVIGVVSQSSVDEALMGAWPLRFTAAQLAQIQ